MKNDLFDFFNEKLSGKGLVFKYIKTWYYGFLVSSALLIIVGTTMQIILKNILHRGITFIAFFLVFAGIILSFNFKVKKTLKNKYGITYKKFLWNGNEFQNLRRNKLQEYLKSKSFFKSEKIKLLIEIYNREAGVAKVNFPVVPSIFVVLFVPLWNNLISWLYKQNDINTLEQALEIFGVIFLVIVMITWAVMMAKEVFGSLFEDLMNSKYRKMKNLCKLLEDVKYDLELTSENSKNEQFV